MMMKSIAILAVCNECQEKRLKDDLVVSIFDEWFMIEARKKGV